MAAARERIYEHVTAATDMHAVLSSVFYVVHAEMLQARDEVKTTSGSL
jgi:hypothetical protein